MFEFKNKCKTYIMGILNLTEDSFFDGGRYNSLDKALLHCQEMINDGVDIIDIGAVSTRPGFNINKIISIEEEKDRILSIVNAIKQRFNIPLSVDTFRWEVAEESLKAGVDIINNQNGFKCEKKMLEVLARYDCYCVLMHNKDCSKYVNQHEDFINMLQYDLTQMVENAINAGVNKEKIIVDPGIGFGKNTQQNLQILKNIKKIKSLGKIISYSVHRYDDKLEIPLLLGYSRKSFIGEVLNNNVEDRLYGTLAVTAFSFLNNVDMIRIHDVKANAEIIKMLQVM